MADTYTVGSGKQDVVLNPNGAGFKSVWEFPVTVTGGPAQGTHFTVTLDSVGMTADKVHQAITDQLEILEAIHSR